MLVSSYNPVLVVSSFVVAILASYTAVSMASQISRTHGKTMFFWLGGGAFAMGLGVWSMHFIGMLAFSLPIELGYDPWLTLLSLLVAMASSGFALWLACRRTLTKRRLSIGALVMGMGVAGMHYLGMEAMMMMPRIVYDPFWFALSLLIAVTASGAALWITAYLGRRAAQRTALKLAAAIVMGCAIVGMHYSGMEAAQFPLGSICGAAIVGVDTHWLSIIVAMVTLAVLAIALIITVLDSRHTSRTGELNRSLHKANKALEHMALHDALTRLPNRALLADRIEQAIETAQRNSSRFTVLFMDLDGFKTVNDAYGHAVGDQLLVETAQRIRSGIRAEDTVARFGGDEFVVLSPIGEADDIATLAAKIVDLVSQPYNIRDFDLRLSTSVGIAIYPEDGQDSHALLVNADAAMYYRKDMGRNGYSFFDPSMNANAEEHLQLVQDLRRAIERKELVLYYQPRFDDPEGPVKGAEALVRWRPQRVHLGRKPNYRVNLRGRQNSLYDNFPDHTGQRRSLGHCLSQPVRTLAAGSPALAMGHPADRRRVRLICIRTISATARDADPGQRRDDVRSGGLLHGAAGDQRPDVQSLAIRARCGRCAWRAVVLCRRPGFQGARHHCHACQTCPGFYRSSCPCYASGPTAVVQPKPADRPFAAAGNLSCRAGGRVSNIRPSQRLRRRVRSQRLESGLQRRANNAAHRRHHRVSHAVLGRAARETRTCGSHRFPDQSAQPPHRYRTRP
ncbi:putative bifunctional diguanylate cyclase/phosphodiesterase [Pusillimonas sp.]|uniref:putative bifunctional diguanylate cyclase/phosphodiesterase n=1 Tax=Pusillimonas sp. TaxID=3040095 RepID=UPI0037C57884